MTVAEFPDRRDDRAAPSYDRTPPQDVAAEQSVLGGMLLSKDAIADVVEVLRGHDMYRPAHETIYEAILDLYGKGEPADPVTVAAELQKQGIPVKEFLPKEKADGWVDNWQIVKGTPNSDCAYKYINFILSPRGQCGVSSVTGYSAANPVAAKECMSPEEYTAKHQDDIKYVDSLVMWEMPARLDVYTNTWNAIKAAE